MQPEIHLGPLTLQTFGIMFALGFVAAGARDRASGLTELGKPVDWAYEMIFAALAGGLVGARVYYMVQNWDDVQDDFFGNLFSGSGLVWYGGAIGGAIAVCAWARWRGFLALTLLDVCAPALALGYAIGRIGCQLSGDGDYGKPSDLPWAMAYPGRHRADRRGGPPDAGLRDARDGPRRLGAVALRDRLAARESCSRSTWCCGLERFLVEFIRRNDEVCRRPDRAAAREPGADGGRRASGSLIARSRRSRSAAAAYGAPPLRRHLSPQPASVSPCTSASCWAERWSPPSSSSSRFGLGGALVELLGERVRHDLVAARVDDHQRLRARSSTASRDVVLLQPRPASAGASMRISRSALPGGGGSPPQPG